MTIDASRANPDREQTDESLRSERQKADELGQGPTAIEDIADEVIEKARKRADRVLAEARLRNDEQIPEGAQGAEPRRILARERKAEDAALSKERGVADDILKAERAEHAAHLGAEREETDRHLSLERARSDTAVTTRDEFLGIASHDLRNMLGAVLGFGSLIAEAETRADHRDEVLRLAGRIQRAGIRMNRLIGDLVDLASIEAGRLMVAREAGDPMAVVEEAVDTFRADAEARGVALLTEAGSGTLVGSFDPARLLQVLVNLVTNAIKFTPRGGRVVVRVESAGNDTKFSVRDTGVGIPEDKLSTVFERYRQVAPNDRRGVGLGLYISKCIVSGHGGKIWVESRLGEGSTFHFSIPAAA
jgi:signal transduction histidine kinase